jgi:hypothetical protein
MNKLEKIEGIYDLKTEEGNLLLSQPLYNIVSTDQDSSVKIFIIDFNDSGGRFAMPELFEKEIFMKKELVEIKNDNKIESISDFLNQKFVEILQDLSDKSRNLEDIKDNNYKFDIDEILESVKEREDYKIQIVRKIIARINNVSNWIATRGRIGPAHYIITGKETNRFLLEQLDSINFHLSIFRFFVDERIAEGKIIMGRKNDFDLPGILLILNENSLSDLVYNEEGKLCVNLIYAFSANGFAPEKQYYTILLKNN